MLKPILLVTALLFFSFSVKANTYYVTTVSDTGAGSLRAMVDSANNNPGLDTVLLSLGVHDTIHIGSHLPAITDTLVVTGRPCQNPTIFGNYVGFTGAAIICNFGVPVTFNYLNIFNCKSTVGGYGSAGAITAGQLYLNYCYFYGNSDSTNGAAGAGHAGAVYSETIYAYNSTFNSNYYIFDVFGSGEGGGAINTSNGYLYNCTFLGNASHIGGALYGDYYAIENCTLTGNYADTGGAIGNNNPHPVINITNSIIWGNLVPGGNSTDQFLWGGGAFNPTVVSGGCNILQDMPLQYAGSDIIDSNPQFGTFGYYSGCVPVIPILCGSVAQNHATCTGATATDAEGIPAQGIRDAGAFELTRPVLGGDTIDSIQHGGTASLYNYFNTTGCTITWPAGLNDSSAAAVDTGTYTVIATNGFGCSDTATVTILYNSDTLNTGLKGIATSTGFKIYPNPAKDVTLISWPNTLSGELTLKVNDILGQVVIQQTADAVYGKCKVNTSALVNGVYVISVQQAQGNIASAKLVVSGK